MSIVLDLQTLQSDSRQRGIGRYSLGLAKALISSDAFPFTALFNAAMPLPHGEISDLRSLASERFDVSVFAGVSGTAGREEANLGRARVGDIARDLHVARLAPGLVHLASPFDGYGDDTVVGRADTPLGVPSVATLYDLIPFEHPDEHLVDPARRRWYEARLETLRRADALLAISEHTRRAALELMSIEPDRVVTVMGDTDPIFRRIEISPEQRQLVLSRYGITRPFLMHTGILDPRKNVDALIRAFSLLDGNVQRSLQIVLVAKTTETQRELYNAIARRSGLADDTIVFAGFVPDDDLVLLYNCCRALVFPSVSEGLGLPPLEAMRCGRPALGAATTSTAEVIADPELLFDPRSDWDIARKLHRLLTDVAFYDQKCRAAVEQAARFSWEKTAAIAAEVFRDRMRASGVQPFTYTVRWPPTLAAEPRRSAEEKLAQLLDPGVVADDGLPIEAVYASEVPPLAATAEQPVIVLLPDKGPTAALPSREALYRAFGYRCLMNDAEEARGNARLPWEHHPGVLAVIDLDGEASAGACSRLALSARSALIAVDRLAQEAARGLLDRSDLAAGALVLAERDPARSRTRRLFVDVTELSQRDARSGIQRVVRSVLHWLFRDPNGFRIEPIRLVDGRYVYARSFACRFLDLAPLALDDSPVDFGHEDVFLGLDLTLSLPPPTLEHLLYRQRLGLKLWFVVYDLLPVLRPDCFPPPLHAAFADWLTMLGRHADGIVAISRSVADEFASRITRERPSRPVPIEIGFFHLGGDLAGSLPSTGIRESDRHVIERLAGHPYFLKVATIEPRKGHRSVLDAFEEVWGSHDAALVLVGSAGWMMDDFITRLRTHPEFGKRLFWLSGASDEVLDTLYRSSRGVIQASEGEGFGLPLIEAAKHGIPILARDIPVFREIAGDHAAYFTDAAELGALIRRHLEVPLAGSSDLPWQRWEVSAGALLDVIEGRCRYRQWPTVDSNS